PRPYPRKHGDGGLLVVAMIRLDQEVHDELLRFKTEVQAGSLGEAVREALKRARGENDPVEPVMEGTCLVNGVSYTHRDIRRLKAELPESNRSAQVLHQMGLERPGEQYNLWDIADRLGITERSKASQFM